MNFSVGTKNEKNEDYSEFNFCGNWRMQCHDEPHDSMVMLHLIVLFLFFDVVAFVLRLFLRRKKESRVYRVLHKIYRCGALPVVIFIIVMIYGLTNMTEVKQTDYSLATVKEIGNYKIALLTDTHFDTIQSKNTVKEALTNLQNQHPDFWCLAAIL